VSKAENYIKPITAPTKFPLSLLFYIGKPFYWILGGLIITVLWLFQILFQGLYTLGKIRIKTPPKPNKSKLKVKPKKAVVKKPFLRLRVPSIKWIIFWVILLNLGFLFWFVIIKDLPPVTALITRKQEVSTKIYDRNGILLYKIYKNENRTILPITDIPQNVIWATLAAEDAEFYNHLGFSPRGILRAFVRNIKEGKLSGGSTITQQLVKNALLTPEKTLVRKIKELILSFEVELNFTKDEILEMYLNEISYGGTAYGIQEASQQYLGKDAKDLNLPEAALLAGLTKSPSKLSPFGANPDLAFVRQREILDLMVINKYITGEQRDLSRKERITFASQKTDIKAPHFVMYLRQILAEKYGEEVVSSGGLEVITSLDYQIQKTVEEIVKKQVDSLGNYRVGNGAALVLDPQNGQILAMVGSKNYFDIEADGNVNLVTALRQPGSSIKAVNYAYALGNKYTLASIIDDSPVTFAIPGSDAYTPKNYDGKYRGKISLRSALAESRNIPAVKLLASYGVDKMIELGQKMGISTWDQPGRFGLSLTLGGGEVKLIDLATAYSVLANQGQKPTITPILKITNFTGRVLEEHFIQNTTSQVVDPRIAFLLTDVLKDNTARTPAFGQNSALVIKGHPEVAVKTGTSNSLRDNLTVGYTQDYLVATWVGNNDNSPMSGIASGITGAAPIFNQIMTYLLSGKESIPWKVPEGVQKVKICSLLGTLPCSGCPTKEEYFLEETTPTKGCVFTPPSISTDKILEGAKTER
jgi:penicillin-binding protein 1C